MLPPTTPLSGFPRQLSWPLGLMTLPITIYDYHGQLNQTIEVEFMVVRAPSPYNIILGRPRLRKLSAIPFSLHSLMKFQTWKGIAIIRGEKLHSNICNQFSRKREHLEETNKAEGVKHKIINVEHPEQTLVIAANFPKVLKGKLQEDLQFNKDIFAWTPTDMIGIP